MDIMVDIVMIKAADIAVGNAVRLMGLDARQLAELAPGHAV